MIRVNHPGRWRAATLLLLAAVHLNAGEGPWQTLFDGSNTGQWTGGIGQPFPADSWKAEEGWLHALPNPIGTSLYSRETYRDFELEWEWKIGPRANSGVKYRCRPEWLDPDFAQSVIPRAQQAGLIVVAILALAGFTLVRARGLVRWIALGVGGLALVVLLSASYLFWMTVSRVRARPPGLEYQMIDDGMVPAAKGRTGAIYDLVPPVKPAPSLVGSVHRSRIIVDGNRIEHWLDGEKILDAQLGSLEFREAVSGSKFRQLPGFADPAEGYLQLQHHQTEAWFRNIRIRRLTP